MNKPSGQGARRGKTVAINVGSYVKVEADRGEDLGVVITKVPIAEYIEESATTAGHKVCITAHHCTSLRITVFGRFGCWEVEYQEPACTPPPSC